MIKVFFYLNFKNTQYINQITTEYIVTNGKINIEFYNSKENKFIVNKDKAKNNCTLNGKLYYLNLTLGELVKKISNINNIQISNRTRYEINTIEVVTDKGIENNVYVIL
jgi:hypothetical protein